MSSQILEFSITRLSFLNEPVTGANRLLPHLFIYLSLSLPTTHWMHVKEHTCSLWTRFLLAWFIFHDDTLTHHVFHLLSPISSALALCTFALIKLWGESNPDRNTYDLLTKFLIRVYPLELLGLGSIDSWQATEQEVGVWLGKMARGAKARQKADRQDQCWQ